MFVFRFNFLISHSKERFVAIRHFSKIEGDPPRLEVSKLQCFNGGFPHVFNGSILDVSICAMVKSRYIGDGHPSFHRNPYNGYINPYYWVDDHPLLYGNNGSLDPGTYVSSLEASLVRHLFSLKLILRAPDFEEKSSLNLSDKMLSQMGTACVHPLAPGRHCSFPLVLVSCVLCEPIGCESRFISYGHRHSHVILPKLCQDQVRNTNLR